ncbi:MAG: (2Fe-2S) ferredoxin domain-containing protein [Clostridiales bacterium]|nr:(2Fe-2S) ferredoxin domain-containing protein [Clostridiales bacterium]
MPKLASWDELKQHREDSKSRTSLLSPDSNRIVLAVGEATCGIAAGAKEIAAVLQSEIENKGLENISIIATGCYGMCYAEPMVEVREAGKPSVYYGYVTESVAKSIVARHLVAGSPVEENVLHVEVQIP